MALFPSVIPWTLVLTQVMTAGLAVVPGRWAHLFRKCLQVQVLCGWERAGGPKGQGYHFWLGLALWGRRREKKKSPCTLQKAEEESENVHKIRGPQYSFFRCALSHAHINIQCQALDWGWGDRGGFGSGGRSGAGHLNPGEAMLQPTQKAATPTALDKLPTSRKKDAWYKPITPFSWKHLHLCQSTLSTRSCYELVVSSPKRGLSVAGEMVSVR